MKHMYNYDCWQWKYYY